MMIWCCACNKHVDARLTDGAECYPHRPDLADVPRWKCDTCLNHVGTHHKTKDRTKPLGVIPSKEITKARMHIHALIDPVWKKGKISRKSLYAKISEALGHEYHTGEIKTIDEAKTVYRIALSISREVDA